MLDLQSDQQKIDPPNDHVLQVVFALRVLKLDVQTILDTYVHLDAAVHLRRYPIAVYPDIFLSDHIRHAPGHCNADEIPQSYIDAGVGFVLFLDILEVELECLGVLEVARSCELLAQ